MLESYISVAFILKRNTLFFFSVSSSLCVFQQIRAITENPTNWDMEEGTSGINTQSLSWHIQACYESHLSSKFSKIGWEMKNCLPVDRHTNTVWIWTSCHVVGASLYKETVNDPGENRAIDFNCGKLSLRRDLGALFSWVRFIPMWKWWRAVLPKPT